MIYNSPAPNNGVGLYFLGRTSAVRYPGESSSNSDVVRSLVDGEPVSIVKTSLETAQQILVADYFPSVDNNVGFTDKWLHCGQ